MNFPTTTKNSACQQFSFSNIQIEEWEEILNLKTAKENKKNKKTCKIQQREKEKRQQFILRDGDPNAIEKKRKK